jgi:redox-sensing transcriptional repressor
VTSTIPPATVGRLPRYLRFLESVPSVSAVVSSEDIAAGSGVTAVQVRKDLSHLGAGGTRGVGYEVGSLRGLIARALGLVTVLPVAIVGAGNLGTALAHYKGFESRGFAVRAMYDVSGEKVGAVVDGITVRHLDALAREAPGLGIAIGIIATPSDAAQLVADRLVEAGVRSILNFAPVVVLVPAGVTVRQVDLATELQILSYHLSHG